MWLRSWILHGLHYIIILIRANISGLLTIDENDVLVSGKETRRVIHLEPSHVLSTLPSTNAVNIWFT